MQPLGVDEPTVVGPYRLLGRLGSGGMGRVYLGRSAGGRTVAVKIVHPHFALDEEFRARFRREVEAARRVGGAWTAPVLDADPEAAVPWVATAYAAGPSLTTAVTDAGALPAHTVRVLGAGLAEALSAVHGLGLVHRDVKPSNVLLTLDGPLLIDFGIARATDGTASLTSTGVSIGSPGYMSPEQILGKGVTGAADVFSLGAVLAYAATGAQPFPGDSSAALLYKVVHEEPELGALDGELREVVESCLRKNPADRPTPAELARRLAPNGAATLVATGWLPGPLVERVSRSAVEVLNLEATGADQGSGVVGFSSPSVEATGSTGVGGGTGAGGTGALGVFGPPPVMTPTPAVPQPRDAGPEEQARPGKVSVSVAATSVPGTDGKGRRMSCTVALAVAGALAAVTVGSVFVFDLLPNRGGSDAQAGADTTHSQSPGASEAPASGSLAAYVGTWEGEGTALKGKLPIGTFRLTVKEAEKGEKLGTLRQTDLIGNVCDDVLTLKSVTAKKLVATSKGADDNHGGCNPATTTVTLTPVGDDLDYASDSEESGNPTARLSKIK
ncbi:serine/threonine-protein kinase [Streptomyces sp. GXMU-J15]|uniref:Serine/threonine-protein kinase n=1 Tax=Streptomyces fuscus TaxID=3048495 RepID=A0ABT7J9L4_9ACTN|nr:serine/threonine-protein kinase [Streptomyces fuscus]MDL2081559.1 serine/threonine-protein kinase [Streptomyces fuscus]